MDRSRGGEGEPNPRVRSTAAVSAKRGRPPAVPPEAAHADANVFVALFAGQSHPLHDLALDLFRRVAEGRLALLLSPVIVAELVCVARGTLGWTRSATAAHLAALLEADGLLPTEPATLARALELYGADQRLDFPDAYLAALALEVGPPAVVSFDRDLDAVEGLRRIAS